MPACRWHYRYTVALGPYLQNAPMAGYQHSHQVYQGLFLYARQMYSALISSILCLSLTTCTFDSCSMPTSRFFILTSHRCSHFLYQGAEQLCLFHVSVPALTMLEGASLFLPNGLSYCIFHSLPAITKQH